MREKVDFSSENLKIDHKPQYIGVLGAKFGLKKSIFLGKPRFKLHFNSKYWKIVPNTQDIEY